MDSPHRSNGSNPRPATQAPARGAGRSRVAGRVDRVLNTALAGERAVDQLMAAADRIPVYRLAIALSRAASDVDIEALMRQPASERAAVATVLACGLRRDVLRVSPLLGIAHDRRWPRPVRLAACKALATIADSSAADGLHRLAESDPDPLVKKAAERAHRRLVRRAVGKPR